MKVVRASVSASNPRSTGCSSWVEKLLFFLVCLEVCKPVSPQEHIMEEHSDGTSGVCPGASENGETVSLYVDDNHPLLQLKRALPWEALFEVMTRHWRRAGKNTDGRPGLAWDVTLYVVWSKNSCGLALVVFQEPAASFSTVHRAWMSFICP